MDSGMIYAVMKLSCPARALNEPPGTNPDRRDKTMMPDIKKILYATDLSDNSAYALRYAVNLALKHDAEIAILHVFEPISTTNSRVLELYLNDELRRRIFNGRASDTIDRIRNRLEAFCDREFNGDQNLAARIDSVQVCEGFPAEEILNKADTFDCDVIVMGTHGKGFIRHTFLGSTAKRVLGRTRKPVFIIPLPKGEIDITFHSI